MKGKEQFLYLQAFKIQQSTQQSINKKPPAPPSELEMAEIRSVEMQVDEGELGGTFFREGSSVIAPPVVYFTHPKELDQAALLSHQ